VIIAEHISKYYRVKGQEKMVFRDLSLQLSPGSRLALIGPNGAGKSTLLRVLSGIEQPNSGRVIRKSSISWPVGVSAGFIATLTARENIKFVCRLFNLSRIETKEKIEFVEDFADVGSYFDMPMATYSSGMRPRVAFGLSLSFDFDFYIIDEVLSVGDANFKEKSRIALRNKAQGKGIVMVSHSMGTIKKFCNQGIYLNQGKLEHNTDLNYLIKRYMEDCQVV
jgi:capsular polysaccharide transport system ATP-binding protein